MKERLIAIFNTAREKILNVNRKRMIIFVLSGMLVIIAISTIVPYFFADSSMLTGEATGSTLTDATDIELYTVKQEEITDRIEVLGQITFYEKVNISSKVNGRIEKVYLQEGKKVRKGQLLAQIERLPLKLQLQQQEAKLDISKRSFDLSRAKYENALRSVEIKLKTIEKAEADLKDKKVSFQNMDRMLKNKKKLYDIGGVSESDLESLKAQHTTLYTKYLLSKSDLDIQRVGYRDQDIQAEGYDVPKSAEKRIELLKKINTKIERAELEAARSKVHQARKSIESTQMLLRETSIRSPIHGVVAAKNMDAGEMIKDDSVIGTILNISKVFVSFNVSEKDVNKLKTGLPVEFTVDAVDDTTFKGSINRIVPVLDNKTRTVEVKVLVNNAKRELLPGMFARARIMLGSSNDKILVPSSSLLKKDGLQGELYVVKKGLAFKQKVTLGIEYDDGIEVKEGLQPEDIIISKGIHMVYAGMKVDKSKSKR